MGRSPRGRIVGSHLPIATESGAVIEGKKPLIIVYVRDTSRARKELAYQCARLGIVTKLVHDTPGLLAFDAIGSPHALETLTGHWCIDSWSFALSCSIPFRCAGSGSQDDADAAQQKRMVQARQVAEIAAKKDIFGSA